MTIVSDLEEISRLQVVKTAARAVVTATVLLVAYYLIPVERHPHESILLRFVGALVLLGVVLFFELRSIVRSDQPTLRATVAMATIIPLFIVTYSWLYLTMSRSSPAQFGLVLNRTGALYFTITVFSTVGFGDITPKLDAARLLTSAQMLLDLALIGVVVRLLLRAASKGRSQRATAAASEPAGPAD